VSRRQQAAIGALVTVLFFWRFHYELPPGPAYSIAGPLSMSAFLFSPLSPCTLMAILCVSPTVLTLFGQMSFRFLVQTAGCLAIGFAFPKTRGRAWTLVLAGTACSAAIALGAVMRGDPIRLATPAVYADPLGLPPHGATAVVLIVFTLLVTGTAVWRNRRWCHNVISLFWLSVFWSAAVQGIMKGGLNGPMVGTLFWFSAGIALRAAQNRPLRPRPRWIFLTKDLRNGAAERRFVGLVNDFAGRHPGIDVHVVVRDQGGDLEKQVRPDLPVTALFPKGPRLVRMLFRFGEWVVYQWIHRPEGVIALQERLDVFALAAAVFSPSPRLVVVESSEAPARVPPSWPVRFAARALYRMSDRVVAVSPEIKRDVTATFRLYDRKVAVVPSGDHAPDPVLFS
jgi:hypothetical protein